MNFQQEFEKKYGFKYEDSNSDYSQSNLSQAMQSDGECSDYKQRNSYNSQRSFTQIYKGQSPGAETNHTDSTEIKYNSYSIRD
jgi:hypothetical protein